MDSHTQGEQVNDLLNSGPRIAVILGYHNGKTFIEEQLRSISTQSLSATKVYLFDDASDDGESFDPKDFGGDIQIPITVIRREKNLGYAKNFLNGLHEIDEYYDYYCFSDQDDIWHEEKLRKAISVLSNKLQTPSLYCGTTQLYSSDMKRCLGKSSIFGVPSFDNAMVQSIAGGNTMVFNAVAKNLVCKFTKDSVVASHDWWVYQVVTAVGGYVYYDREPYVKYRQHGNNQVGSNKGIAANVSRLVLALKGRYKCWNDMNIKALLSGVQYITPENKEKLLTFSQVKNGNVWHRIRYFKLLKTVRFGYIDRVAFMVLFYLGMV